MPAHALGWSMGLAGLRGRMDCTVAEDMHHGAQAGQLVQWPPHCGIVLHPSTKKAVSASR